MINLYNIWKKNLCILKNKIKQNKNWNFTKIILKTCDNKLACSRL